MISVGRVVGSNLCVVVELRCVSEQVWGLFGTSDVERGCPVLALSKNVFVEGFE